MKSEQFMSPLQWVVAAIIIVATAFLVHDKLVTVGMELLLLGLLYAGHKRRQMRDKK